MPMVAAEPEYKSIEKVEEGPWAELGTPADSAVSQARQLTLPGLRPQHVKATGKVALVLLGCALVAAVWVHHHEQGVSTSATPGDVDEVEAEFQIKTYPQDCGEYLRYQGCEKEKWSCDKAYAPDLGYRCCCETSIWHFPHYSKQLQQGREAGGSLTDDAPHVLRILRAPSRVCLAGPKDFGGHFTLEDCGNAGTHFKLPARGAGHIELDNQPGQCLTVADGTMTKLDVQPCASSGPQASQQMFQLTNGDKGMLQWSHGGNRCLDSETSKVEKLSKIVLADCVYWPEKPSQVFVLEDAPKEKPEKEEEDKDEEEEEDKEEVKVHPSLFCTSLMLPWSYEVGMLRYHLKEQIGIFACTEWAVYSNEKVKLKEGATPEEDVFNDIMNGSLKAKIGGKFHTALNTPVFVRFWARLIEDGRPFKYDWTIKVDPDCVFFPDRLTEMLKNSYTSKEGVKGVSDKPVWLNNCQLGLHGPIEVFNNHAFGIYSDDPSKCDGVAEKHGQEDVFLKECFTHLQIPRRDAYNLLLEADWACNERPSSSSNAPPCYDRQVSFHPFKSVETYKKCYEKAADMTWNTPLYINGNPPGPANHHHA